jgi:hypothetical protein
MSRPHAAGETGRAREPSQFHGRVQSDGKCVKYWKKWKSQKNGLPYANDLPEQAEHQVRLPLEQVVRVNVYNLENDCSAFHIYSKLSFLDLLKILLFYLF